MHLTALLWSNSEYHDKFMFNTKYIALKILPVATMSLLPVIVLAQTIAIQNPLGTGTTGTGTTIPSLITSILGSLMLIGAPISILLIVFVGFKFVMAQGKESELNTAKQNFLYTILGIVIFFGATLIMGVLTTTINQFSNN